MELVGSNLGSCHSHLDCCDSRAAFSGIEMEWMKFVTQQFEVKI